MMNVAAVRLYSASLSQNPMKRLAMTSVTIWRLQRRHGGLLRLRIQLTMQKDALNFLRFSQ